jgi:hypothetical protein
LANRKEEKAIVKINHKYFAPSAVSMLRAAKFLTALLTFVDRMRGETNVASCRGHIRDQAAAGVRRRRPGLGYSCCQWWGYLLIDTTRRDMCG